mgnify:CR=1 FL=1
MKTRAVMFLLVMLVGGPALASQGVTPEEEAKALQLWLDRGTGLEEARTALNAQALGIV